MKIILRITKPLYREYFNFIFPPSEDGSYKITRETDLGKAICGFVKYSNMPVLEELTSDHITIHLPNANSLSNAKNYHCYLTKEDQLKINDLIEVFFNIDFDRYYLKGLAIELQQKEIIESFIVSRKLTNLLSDNETLKKRHYREEIKNLKVRVEQLRQKAYYRHKQIEFEPEKYLIN